MSLPDWMYLIQCPRRNSLITSPRSYGLLLSICAPGFKSILKGLLLQVPQSSGQEARMSLYRPNYPGRTYLWSGFISENSLTKSWIMTSMPESRIVCKISLDRWSISGQALVTDSLSYQSWGHTTVLETTANQFWTRPAGAWLIQAWSNFWWRDSSWVAIAAKVRPLSFQPVNIDWDISWAICKSSSSNVCASRSSGT